MGIGQEAGGWRGERLIHGGIRIRIVLTDGVNSAKQRGKGAPKKKRTKEGKESTHEYWAVLILSRQNRKSSAKGRRGLCLRREVLWVVEDVACGHSVGVPRVCIMEMLSGISRRYWVS